MTRERRLVGSRSGALRFPPVWSDVTGEGDDRMDIPRRGLLAAGAGLLAATAAPALAAEALRPTPRNELGPFYRRHAPHEATLAQPGDVGQRLVISGAVFRSTGELLPNAHVELWHADDAGRYDVDGDRFR